MGAQQKKKTTVITHSYFARWASAQRFIVSKNYFLFYISYATKHIKKRLVSDTGNFRFRNPLGDWWELLGSISSGISWRVFQILLEICFFWSIWTWQTTSLCLTNLWSCFVYSFCLKGAPHNFWKTSVFKVAGCNWKQIRRSSSPWTHYWCCNQVRWRNKMCEKR